MKKTTLIVSIVLLSIFCIGFFINSTQARTNKVLPKVKKVRVAETYTKKIKLQWKKVQAAKYYQIRVLTKKNQKYQLVKKIKTKKNTRRKLVKKLKSGKKYYLRIRAFKNKRYGPYSKRVSATTDYSPWPMFRGNLQHTGLSPYSTADIKGEVKWSYETGDGIESSPVIGKKGTIYIGSHDGKLYAFNPDGTKKWEFNTGAPKHDDYHDVDKAIMATPAVAADGTIYIHSSSNYLYAINPNGTRKWRFYLNWGIDFWPCPIIGEDGTIYIGSARNDSDPDHVNALYAINPNGTEKWHYTLKSGVTSSPAITTDGTIYIAAANPSTNKGKVHALNLNGTQKWVFTTERWLESSATVSADGTIYIGGGRESAVYAINPNGTQKWKFKTQDGVSAVPAIGADGTVYIGSWDNYFYALDPDDGSLIWKYLTEEAFEGVSSSAAISADDTIYVGSNSGYFYAFNPDGTLKWRFDDAQGSGVIASPAINDDGTIYLASWNHKLYAIK